MNSNKTIPNEQIVKKEDKEKIINSDFEIGIDFFNGLSNFSMRSSLPILFLIFSISLT